MTDGDSVEEFMRRLVTAAPTLSEEQLANIRRAVAGASPWKDTPNDD
jgi:hypothetical protein